MSVAFKPGQALGPEDLKISVRDSAGNLVDPEAITFSIFDITTGVEILIGTPDQIPHSPSVGMFYANVMIPLDANIGDWIVRWNFRETIASPIVQVVQEFAVIDDKLMNQVGTGTEKERLMIARLRTLLRDNNPDRNYRFRPPNTDKFIQTQTEVFGYVWTDEEMLEYILMALDDLNSYPPYRNDTLATLPDRWRSAVLIRACAFACRAAAINWAVDEMTYSIGGVSLDLEKSSKYQAMADGFDQQYEQMRTGVKASIKITKGLSQQRWGIGIHSALGPLSKPGVLSRRNFVG